MRQAGMSERQLVERAPRLHSYPCRAAVVRTGMLGGRDSEGDCGGRPHDTCQCLLNSCRGSETSDRSPDLLVSTSISYVVGAGLQVHRIGAPAQAHRHSPEVRVWLAIDALRGPSFVRP